MTEVLTAAMANLAPASPDSNHRLLEEDSNQKQRNGLIVTLSLYFCMMLSMGVLAWRIQRRRHAEAAARASDTAESAEGAIASHFVAGNSLGLFVTVFTLFASLFSGYTVVGVPNESYRTGFVAFRWIPCILFICFGLLGTQPRMRRASLVRHHQSPCDFITDRFRSQLLRYTILFLMLCPSIIYLAAQLISLSDTFNDLFSISHDDHTAVICIAIFILLLEFIGGLSVVAYTDSIQGVMMIVGFILMGSTMCALWGSWSDSIFDPTTYPKPAFFQVPSAETQLGMWTYSFSWVSFLSLPHFIQRTYACDSFRNLKVGFYVITIAPWLTMMVGLYVGTVGVWALQDEGTVSSPFTAIISRMMDESDFGYFAGLIVLTTSIAAIMSTADSLLIAISHLVTSEVFWPLRPRSTPGQIDIAAKVISTVTMAISLAVAITDDGGLSDLSSIQNGMSLQACPAFIIGLFFPSRLVPHAWCLAVAALCGFVTVVTVKYTYDEDEDNYQFNSGVWGLLTHLGILAILEGALRLLNMKRAPITLPAWDSPPTARFGEQKLTHELLSTIMDGIYEPYVRGWFVPLVFVLSFAALPTMFTSAGLPPLGTEVNGTYPDFRPTTVGGLPDWTFKLLMVSVVFTLTLLYGVYKLPDELDDLGAKKAEPAKEELIVGAGDSASLYHKSVRHRSQRMVRNNSTATASSDVVLSSTTPKTPVPPTMQAEA